MKPTPVTKYFGAIPNRLQLAGGQTLLQEACDRLAGIVPDAHRRICAGEGHREITNL